MAYKMSPNTKLVVTIVVIFAIVIPILLAYVLIFPLGLSPTRTVASSSSSIASTSSVSGQSQITIPAGIGTNLKLNFQPDSVTVQPGTTIVWTNDDTSTHNIYFTSVPSGASIPTNPSPDTTSWSGNTYSVTLTVPGTYTYVCQYHGWMTGTIVVS